MIGKKHIYTLFDITKNLRLLSIYKNSKPFVKGVKRVYHHHLMKTGGTSLNKMFINLSRNSKSNKLDLYDKLMNQRDLRLVNNGWIYTAWNQLSLSSGLWHYGWSHRPIYKTFLPSETFKITSLREPRKRVFSRYKQLIKYYNGGDIIRNHQREFEWLGKNFEEYLENIPQQEMCHQLFMFSKNLDVEEGIKRLASMDYIINLNTFNKDVKNINYILDLNLKPIHTRKSKTSKDVDLEMLFSPIIDKIKPEMEFYKRALEYKYSL